MWQPCSIPSVQPVARRPGGPRNDGHPIRPRDSALTADSLTSGHKPFEESASPFPKTAFSPEAVALLGISAIRGVGFQTMVRLRGIEGVSDILRAQSVSAFENAIAQAGAKIPANSLPDTWNGLERLITNTGEAAAAKLSEAGTAICFLGNPSFPQTLASLPDQYRPLWIFYRGDLSILQRPCVTVVGTRDPTQHGEFLSRYAVSCVRPFGTPVVSGLARGVDRIVHEWCLRLGLPTVSVMGTGMLTTYPARHAGLGDEIVKSGGLLISEYFPHQGPTAENFVWRNRLQAALGRVTIPAEWAKKSGTAHTVRFAHKFNRKVFSISLSGLARHQDAGIGDHHFDLPDSHHSFVEELEAAIKDDPVPAPAVPQMDLFGNPR